MKWLNNKNKSTPLKMNEKASNVQREKTFRESGELLLKTTFKVCSKSVAHWKENIKK